MLFLAFYSFSYICFTLFFVFFFFNDTATTEIYTLSLHDALPIFAVDGDVVGERAKIIIEKVVTEFGREVGLGVEEQRSEVVLQGACTAALVVDEIRLAVAQHDVARLKVTVEEIVARGAEK